MEQQPVQPDPMSKLTAKQKRFVEAYCRHLNASKAAREAGYSENNSDVVGPRLLVNVGISQAVKQRLDETVMTVEEAAKITSDVAATRLQDYMVVKKVERPTTITKPVAEVIADIQKIIDFEDEYAALAQLEGDELEAHERRQKQRQRDIIRLELELKYNPNATKQVEGPTEVVEEMDLDLVALAKAEDRGNIKELTYGRYGPTVKMYAADAAAAKILEVHGKIKPADNSTSIVIFQLPDNGR